MIDDGRDMQGKRLYYHTRCNRAGEVVEIKGLLTKATAILCEHHKALALNENSVSKRTGYSVQTRKRKEDELQEGLWG